MPVRRSDRRRHAADSGRCAYRLGIEPLETRRLLAAVQVSVFVDQDGSRSFESNAEAPAANRLVFIDLNRNGTHEPDEPIQLTDETGQAFFEGLEDGDYSVAVLTNPETQRQTTSTRVASQADLIMPANGSQLVALPDLSHPWSIDSQGSAIPILEGQEILQELGRVELGGPVVGVLQDGSTATLLVETSPDYPRFVKELDLITGQVSELGVPNGIGNIQQLIQTASSRYIVFDSGFGTRLAEFSVEDHQLKLVRDAALSGYRVAGSPTSEALAIVSEAGAGRSEIRLHTPAEKEQDYVPFFVQGIVESLEFSADSRRLFVALKGGGVHVLRVLSDDHLAEEAILAEAAGPLSFSTTDNRLLTGDVRHPGGIVVWDGSKWQPVGTSSIGQEDTLVSILPDTFGDRALVVGSSGVYSLQLAIPTSPRLTLESDQSPAFIEIGVRETGRNELPVIEELAPRIVMEDSDDVFSLDDSPGLVDPNGDVLWFSLATPPANGSLERLSDGSWSYVPAQNFSGSDTAAWRVHDGLGSVELVLRWQIEAVNDPPLELQWRVTDVVENPSPNTQLGFVTVVDPDPGAAYRITTSDPRFVVAGGQLLFQRGELDYESESTVVFDVTAVDSEAQYSISSQVTLVVTDVNEPPTGIQVSQLSFPENAEAIAISELSVLDQDAGAEYEFSVSDERFEIQDGQLRLVSGQSIDHEREPRVDLEITAREVGDSGHQITQTISLAVEDMNEPPLAIELDDASVDTQTAGAIVGRVQVADPEDDYYSYSVSDPRFEIVDGVLRLRENTRLAYLPGTVIKITVTATTPNGDSVRQRFPISVAPPSSPHRNPLNASDVNEDGSVTPLDVLILINELNRGGGGELPETSGGAGEPRSIYPDVNGDGMLTPLDVLLIINELNSQNVSRAEGESDELLQAPASVTPMDEDERRRRQNSAIDAELEGLLDELSRHREQDL